MNARMTMLLGILLVTTACGGVTTKDTLTKSEAQALLNSGDADDTVCTDNGFNDDGVCDDWCPDGDTADCPTSNRCTDGETKDADDGCNTCFCEGGSWACTEIACSNNQPSNNDPSQCSDGDTKQADDGCNTCTCHDGHWACTEIACTNNGNGDPGSDVLPLEIGECDTDTDRLDIDSAKIAGDELLVDVGYSGGCAEHEITACWDGSFLESNPVQARLVLEHDANGDMCEAYLQETLTIDLTDMKESYKSGYQTDQGTIIVHVDQAESVDYTF